MEETSSPPLSGLKFNYFYFLTKAMSSDHTPRTPSPMPKKMMKKKKKKNHPGTTVILRRASMKINNNGSFRFKEPRSTKVSCFGKVANNGRNKNQKKRKDDSEGKEQSDTAAISPPNSSFILKLFRVFKKRGTKLANPYAESSSPSAAAASIKSVPKSGHAKDVVVVENIELVPRKEINLWKKRMVAPPPPLLV